MRVKWLVSPFLLASAMTFAFAGGERCRTAARPRDAPAQAPTVPEPPRAGLDDAGARFLFFAVLEGLYEDGVSNQIVERVIELDARTGWPKHFVYACPICTPAFDAFRSYRSRTAFFGRKVPSDTFGDGLDEELARALLDRDELVLASALQELLERWTARRIELLRVSSSERDALAQDLAERKKRGSEFLRAYQANGTAPQYAGMKTCPLCEGASGACPLR